MRITYLTMRVQQLENSLRVSRFMYLGDCAGLSNQSKGLSISCNPRKIAHQEWRVSEVGLANGMLHAAKCPCDLVSELGYGSCSVCVYLLTQRDCGVMKNGATNSQTCSNP